MSAAAALEHLASLPPEQLAQIPSAKPPPGVTPNFIDPATRAPLTLGLSSAFFAVATIFFALRVWTRMRITRIWKIEDTLLSIAWVLAAFFFSVGTLSYTRGSSGRHEWDTHLDRKFFSGWMVAYWVTSALNLPSAGLTRVVILIQYLRMFHTKRSMKLAIISGIVVISAFYTSWTIVSIVLTSPWPGESWIDAILSTHVFKLALLVQPIAICGVIFDFYILFLPIYSVLQLQMSIGRKIGVLFMFMTGALACAASIFSAIWRYQLSTTDISWTTVYLYLGSLIEALAGIIVACAPTVHQFWSRQARLSWLSSSLKSSVIRLSGGRRSQDSNKHSGSHKRAGVVATNNSEEDQRQIMKKASRSMDSARASTMLHQDDCEFDDVELGLQKKSLEGDQILVEHSYTISSAKLPQSRHEDSDTDVEA